MAAFTLVPVFTLEPVLNQALVPGHRHKIVLPSDTGNPSTQAPFSTRVQSRDPVPGHGHCSRILV